MSRAIAVKSRQIFASRTVKSALSGAGRGAASARNLRVCVKFFWRTDVCPLLALTRHPPPPCGGGLWAAQFCKDSPCFERQMLANLAVPRNGGKWRAAPKGGRKHRLAKKLCTHTNLRTAAKKALTLRRPSAIMAAYLPYEGLKQNHI